ncbi:winged helix family two component transcriptional regulator [Geobacillus genomosp. 3]|uniref:Winged helix family two component transcriptional regulator n=1 Tax=Geobacillus genomosp. 3 TaxID=1921421 RepID=V5LVP5_GEOG3|nr:winged helix family two component transcriptional regulator [Geobacillus genomosp. 3]
MAEEGGSDFPTFRSAGAGKYEVQNDVVKKMINKLRERLKPCFSKPMDQIIVNVRGKGYRWECEIPYRIIVPLDDYEYII